VAGVSGRLAPSTGPGGLAFAPPQGAPLSFADIFQQVAPAVVQIDVKTRVRQPRMIQVPGLPFAIPNPNGGQEGEEGADGEGAVAMGAGSGFFIAANGFIVTNNHVVADATEITVKLADGRELEARLVGRDESTDLAVIKVDGSDFPFVNFEESAQPRVGDWVIAVGNPFGLGGTATAGIVSAQGRSIPDPTANYVDFLQIDAAINRGNSGGPTFDIYGRVIGVNSAIYSPTGNSVGIGFAIPASVAKPITDRLMRGESIERGYLGVLIGNVDATIREGLDLPEGTTGAYITEVTKGAPADLAGLRPGDVVIRINGDTIANSTELTRRVAAVEVGQPIRLEIIRDGRRQSVTVRSGRRPSLAELNAGEGSGAEPTEPRSGAASGEVVAGLNVSALTPALRQRFSIPATINGIVVTGVTPGGDRRFQPGNVIMRVGNAPAATVADFQSAVAAARRASRDSVFLLVWTPQGNSTAVLDLPDPE
jgi:serine protease Do